MRATPPTGGGAAGGRALGGSLAALGALGLGALVWGSVVERNRFTLRQETLPVLAPGSRPLAVLHLSDLHMAPWQRQKQEWIRSLTDFEPDLIVSTGDNLGHERGLEGIRYALEPLRGTPGVFVNGSNDYYAPSPKNPLAYFAAPATHKPTPVNLDTDELEAYYASLGWLNLNNAARAMTVKGSNLELVGVNDAHVGWDELTRIPGAIDEMREHVGWQDDPAAAHPITIALTHSPYRRVLNSFVNYGADVIFAGHTHGGQVCLPGLGALVTNCDLPRSQASGLSLWRHARGTAFLNVSAGIGTSIFAPVRFACPPEAVLVTFVANDFGYS